MGVGGGSRCSQGDSQPSLGRELRGGKPLLQFGPAGPVSSPDDEWIGVLGLEVHLEHLLL